MRMWFGILFLMFASDLGFANTCPKNPFKTYRFTRTEAGEDFYASRTQAITMQLKCFSAKETYVNVVERLSKETNVKNLKGDAVYFEFLHHGTHKRVYVINRSPVYQMTFETRRRNRSLLVNTQELVEKFLQEKYGDKGL